MRARTLKITGLAGSVLLWFAIPSFGQTSLMASFSKPTTGMGASGTWTPNAIAAAILTDNSSKHTGKDTLFADGHLRNAHDDHWNSRNDLLNSNNHYQDGNSQGGNGQGGNGQGGNGQGGNGQGGSGGCQVSATSASRCVSAAEGGAAMNYLLLAGIACCGAIYLKRRKQLTA